MSTFNEQITAARKARIDAKYDETRGIADMHAGRSKAMQNKSGIIEVARRIARELGQYGAISINEVSRRLQDEGYESSANVDSKKRRLWKGGVFATAEWVCVGEVPSTFVAMHGRPVKLWALKTWLATNAVNGTNMKLSAFDVSRILSEFKRQNPGARPSDCTWIIGRDRLSKDIKMMIDAEGGGLYGIVVTLLNDTVGAVLARGTVTRHDSQA